MAKTDFKSIDEYHETFTGDILERMQTVRGLVHHIAPEAQEVISYQIPSFKIGEKSHLIYYCAFPKHITLSSPWTEAFLTEFETELKGMKVSKSAIQFPHEKPLPIELIKAIIKFRKEEISQKKK
jgi:uncharacterized protein YdhG (YjbR/CyaY superfamily)